MSLTKEDINKMALLARLELSDEEKEKFRQQLGSVLEYVSKLKEIDTSNVSVVRQIAGLVNQFRPDEMRPADTTEHDLLLKNFPKRKVDLLEVKEVFED